MTALESSPLSPAAQQELRLKRHLDGVRARDAQSLAYLYDDTSRYLYSLALRIVGDGADAEEVVLDVYQRVWNSVATFQAERGSVFGWLLALTRNRAIDRRRSSSTRRTREFAMDPEADAPDATPPPESASIVQQERTLIRQALEMLAPEQRAAIEMAFFEGLSHTEVAETLGLPLGTVKTRIRIGMGKLRRSLTAVRPAREVRSNG